MRITRLKLKNFRNYDDLLLEFNENLNIIIGENGIGKTNILESIYVLSLTKTYRNCQDQDLINKKSEYYNIEGLIENDNYVKKLAIKLENNKKRLYINDKEIYKNREYISNFCVVSFSPDDLDIIKGSPSIRRDLINITISQLNYKYLNSLNEYNSLIKIRNDYLKKIFLNGNTDLRYLDIINNKYIELIIEIYKYRFDYINRINDLIGKIFKNITDIGNLNLIYDNGFNITDFNEEKIRNSIKSKIKKMYNQELAQGITLYGPHRDDIKFILNNNDMKIYSSQGQQRMAVIAYKLSELYLYKKLKGFFPVLLLDDIFSEIDIKRRNKIIKYLKKDIQTIITTTDVNDISDKLLEKSLIYNIKKENIVKKGMIKNGRKSKRKL